MNCNECKYFEYDEYDKENYCSNEDSDYFGCECSPFDECEDGEKRD